MTERQKQLLAQIEADTAEFERRETEIQRKARKGRCNYVFSEIRDLAKERKNRSHRPWGSNPNLPDPNLEKSAHESNRIREWESTLNAFPFLFHNWH